MITIHNRGGMGLKVTGYGATIVELFAPDREGELADVSLGCESVERYRSQDLFLGCIAGRCGNRIAGGRFTLDGRAYSLATNNGPNHLHGGNKGFDKFDWDAERLETDRGPAVRFDRLSPAGEEGYPGALRVSVTYTLSHDNELITEMRATTDQATVCNLVQHNYWNLAGHDSGLVSSHHLTLYADEYTPVDATLIPTGESAPVAGTPFDFRVAKPIGRDLDEVGDDPKGYDHNYVVNGNPTSLRPVARVYEPTTGRIMDVSANQPGVQFYSGNFLDGTILGKGGTAYPRHSGFCLETQAFPNAINEPSWHQPVLKPGETYLHTMVTRFSTDRD